MKHIEIWMGERSAIGDLGTARLIWEGEAENFDDAVKKYNKQNYKDFPHGSYYAERYTRYLFESKKDYENRPSDWHIWLYSLYDNEEDARKAIL